MALEMSSIFTAKKMRGNPGEMPKLKNIQMSPSPG
jgi:hypothetical protein